MSHSREKITCPICGRRVEVVRWQQLPPAIIHHYYRVGYKRVECPASLRTLAQSSPQRQPDHTPLY